MDTVPAVQPPGFSWAKTAFAGCQERGAYTVVLLVVRRLIAVRVARQPAVSLFHPVPEG
jgi:hypothetical protein